jgi:hypothetical protein
LEDTAMTRGRSEGSWHFGNERRHTTKLHCDVRD